MNSEILWYISRSTGATAQVLLTAVLVLGVLTAGRVAAIGLSRAAILRLHRNLALGALVFLAVHILTAIIDGYVSLSFLDVLIPFGSSFDPLWIGLGAVAVDLMAALIITSALRRRMPHKLWRAVHLSAYAMWPIAVLHGWGTSGGDSAAAWMLGVTITCIVAVVGALTYRLTRGKSQDQQVRERAAAAHPVIPTRPLAVAGSFAPAGSMVPVESFTAAGSTAAAGSTVPAESMAPVGSMAATGPRRAGR